MVAFLSSPSTSRCAFHHSDDMTQLKKIFPPFPPAGHAPGLAVIVNHYFQLIIFINRCYLVQFHNNRMRLTGINICSQSFRMNSSTSKVVTALDVTVVVLSSVAGIGCGIFSVKPSRELNLRLRKVTNSFLNSARKKV